MNTVHRHFGKYMKRSADESQISVLLKDFEDADKMLTRVSPVLDTFDMAFLGTRLTMVFRS